METVGCILAGGQGTRLQPITNYLNKHLLHIYNKPMIFYSLSNMLLCGVKKIFIVVNPKDKKIFKKILDDHIPSKFNLKIVFLIQKKPDGIVGGLKLIRKYIKKNTKIITYLGDNFLVGPGLINNSLLPGISTNKGCSFFSLYSKVPKKFGVIKYDKKKQIIKIIEKPKKFISNDIVIGIYIFDDKFLNYLDLIKLSKNNQYEITDLINIYIKNKDFAVFKLGRGTTWIDCGEFDQLYQASTAVRYHFNNYGIDIGNLNDL